MPQAAHERIPFIFYNSAIREDLTGRLEVMIVDRCERQGMPRTNGWLNMQLRRHSSYRQNVSNADGRGILR
jgi:hypothetical protein